MQKIKIWGWDKKIRTMLRFIKMGDIFCFQFKDSLFCFGRIIAPVTTGHLAEIFDCVSDKPCIDSNSIEKAQRIGEPKILDSYSLFDRKAEGEWRIIGHQEDYKAHDFDDIYLTFGIGNDWKRRDLYGNITQITKEEHFKYIETIPNGHYQVEKFVQEHIQELKEILRGNNGIQWSIDSEGLLTISGRQTGHNSWPEWMGYEYAEKIKSVVVTAENVTSTAYWFFNCTNLTTADLSKFDTSNVTDMSWMFYSCSSLANLEMSNCDTGNVTDMSHMFYSCSSLESLDMSNCDTSNVTDMSWMFYRCSSLESLDMSNCDTGNVTDMSWMFKDCNRLSSMEKIDLKETKSSGDCEDNKFIDCEPNNRGNKYESYHRERTDERELSELKK